MEEYEQVHGEQPESGQCYLVFGLVVERLAFQQSPNLILDTLCLAQQPLVDAQSLQPALAATHIIHLGRTIFDCPPKQVFRIGPYVVALRLHLREVINRQLFMWVLRQKLESDFWLALPYHKMHDDEALEHNRPRAVAQPVHEGAKDLGDARFARVGRDEDVFDILGLGRCELQGPG